MARISQKAMNNVVIFAMLIMIALFNIDSFVSKGNKSETVSLVPDGAYVLKIEQGDNRLERAGQSWRRVSEVKDIDSSPEQQLKAWLNASMTAITNPSIPSSAEPLVAVMWLAGQPEGRVFAFYPDDNNDTLIRFENRWFRLNNANVHQLLPWYD